MTNHPLLIISIDAINAKDYQYFNQLPTFMRFINEGAFVSEMTSVYPSVTYTCHASITTGRYPEEHGVYHNELCQPDMPTTQDWRWFDWDVKAPTIFDYANQKGLSVGTLMWPSTAGASHRWNVPEIWSPTDQVSNSKLFWRYGSKNMVLPVMKYAHLMDGKSQPALDNFTEALTHHLLSKKHPDLLVVHLTEIDTIRHIYGFDSPEALLALKSAHDRVTRIMKTLKKSKQGQLTNVVLLGDHGTSNCHSIIEINSYLKTNGFLSSDAQYNIVAWKAYGVSAGGSCHIHCAKDMTSKEHSKLLKLLQAMVSQKDLPIKKLFQPAEAKKNFHLTGAFDYILEAEDGYVFRNSVSDKVIWSVAEVPGAYLGDHGYLPSHNQMKTMLMMMGPDIKKSSKLSTCSLVDLAPTFSELLDLNMEKVQGHTLSTLLK